MATFIFCCEISIRIYNRHGIYKQKTLTDIALAVRGTKLACAQRTQLSKERQINSTPKKTVYFLVTSRVPVFSVFSVIFCSIIRLYA